MKINFKNFAVLIVLLLIAAPVFAMAQDGGVDVSNPASLVAYLTPFIVLGVTWLIKVLKPIIPGWATMFIVMGLSTLLTFLTNQLGDPDLNWIAQFGLGLAATFVHQLYIQFNKS